MKKIVTYVKCCQDCPNSYEVWDYDKQDYTGILKCDLLDESIRLDFATIHNFCPLEDAE